MAAISVKRGDNFRAKFYFTESGGPANLTGCSARMQIRDRYLTLFVEASTDDYLIVDPEVGTVDADIPESVMTIPTGQYQADVQLTYDDGTVRSSDTFKVKVIQDITFADD
jgi:hypothetical protein